MSTADKRHEFRIESGIRYTPVGCILVSENEKIELEVINFHFRGACLKISTNDYRFQSKDRYLLFKIGEKQLSEKIIFRIVWETVSENGLFGVEFEAESTFAAKRAERFSSHSVNTPVISSQDPLDPNRIIYFKVVNASSQGMLLSTSLTNKHIFPGMELRTAVLTVPNIGKADLDLFVENSRSGDEQNVLYGVSVKGSSKNYNTLISKYLSNLGSAQDTNNRLELLADANLLQSQLRAHLTIREIRTQPEYEQVLKLRHTGYARAGKIAATKTWQEMGDGLENEGIVLGAFLGGQLVASCEFRLNKFKTARLAQQFDLKQIPGIRDLNIAEINKLVVHPKAQNSDTVLGIFQKIHALAMLNGRPDGLIAAEPKLIALYERLGFKKTSLEYPHPVKENTNLTLMIMYSEAYASSEGMNPYAWSVAFEETQKFYDEIGVNRSRNLSSKERIIKTATQLAMRFKKKKKKSSQQTQSESSGAVRESSMRHSSDPRWTKQHLNATVMLPYILEAEELVGVEEIKKILLDFGFDKDYFKSVSNWISIDFFDEFISRFSQFGDPYMLNKRAGYRSVTREILGANYFIVKHFFSPGTAFKAFERFLPKFNKTRIYKVIESGSNFTRIRITNPDRSLLPKHPSAKENWYAIVEAYVLTLTGQPAIVTPVKSAFDGDDYCEFVVTWKNRLFTTKSVTYFFALAAAGYWGLSKAYTSVGREMFISGMQWAAIIGTMAWLGYQAKRFKSKYSEMIEAMHEFEREADDRYRELQNSKSILDKGYQEGKILEFLNKEIQVSEDLSQILNTALDYLCTKFEFKRSFVMIKDAEAKYLRTAAMIGASGPLQDLWDFKVDITVQRENPLVLSSVYRSGQSILITNIEEHAFHLNEASKRLLKMLDTHGFAIVPIPSERQNWGVLIADKGSSREVITRRDLVTLQRVAQTIGLALDKKSKIDTEVHIRKVFQKYVPSSVVSDTLGSATPRLGGQKIDAICLFLDIRNFTKMSTQLPPEILCEMLNQVFNIVQKNVAATNGIIDKFLGDGALVTWGAVPGPKPSAEDAIKTAEAILNDLKALNMGYVRDQGLQPVEVGIGIHKGLVIAGNIGSQDRMEFTVIGNTVNVASRLEQLTKMFECQIVISEDLTNFSNLGADWQVFPDVQIRGLDQKVNVAGYKSQASGKINKRESA